MRKRPRIKIELTIADKIVDAIGWAVLFAAWVLTLTSYAELPDIIPTHYNAAGQADGFGAKSAILLLPLLATVLFTGITIMNKYPHIFNYMAKITEENALRQYTNATRMMRYVKLILVLMFGYISFRTIRIATGEAGGLNTLTLWLLLGVLLIAFVYYIVKALRNK